MHPYKQPLVMLALSSTLLLGISVVIELPTTISVLCTVMSCGILTWLCLIETRTLQESAPKHVQQTDYLSQDKPLSQSSLLNDSEIAEHREIYRVVADALDNEKETINDEVARACSLVSDGISGVSDSFYKIKMLSDVQQDYLMQLIALNNEQSVVSTEQINDFNVEMNSAVNNAIRSLQFEDITIQSLMSVSSNITQLSEISEQLRKSSYCKQPIAEQAQKIKLLCEAVVHNCVPPKHRTVSQKNMDEGEIELF